MAQTLTDRLRSLPPGLHGEGNEFWGLAWPALEWLEREVRPGMATLETGAGSSTLAFAAGGAEHVAVTPDPGEEQRIRAQARKAHQLELHQQSGRGIAVAGRQALGHDAGDPAAGVVFEAHDRIDEF